MPSPHEIQDILEEVLSYCEDIFGFVKRFGDSEECFTADVAYQMACIFALQQIGEDIKKIEPWLSSRSDKVKWKDICRFRDFITHNYGHVDPVIVWNIIREELMPLNSEIKRLVAEFNEND